MVYVLILMMLRAKTKIYITVKYKRSESLTITVLRFIFFIVTRLMQPGVLYKISTGSLALIEFLNHQILKQVNT
jgi:hypothetical protein